MKINFFKTERFYLSDSSKPCECEYCKNYTRQIAKEYPKLASHLKNMNVDICRPFELMSLEKGDNRIEYMLCQYIVFGECDDDYSFEIDNVKLEKSSLHPPTSIKDEHFVLEFGPVVLAAGE